MHNCSTFLLNCASKYYEVETFCYNFASYLESIIPISQMDKLVVLRELISS